MYVAVLYTGSLRTIEKTLSYLKKNVLLHNQVHVYACLENDTLLSDQHWTQWLSQEVHGHLQSVQWTSNQSDTRWQAVKQLNLENIHTDVCWAKEYLSNSGSMFEHFQMQTAYKSMVQNEYQTNMHYEYVIRCRTDTIFCKPIDFHWLHLEDSVLAEIVQKIRSHLPPTVVDIVPYLMYCIIHDDILANIANITATVNPTESYSYIQEECISQLNQYIKQGKYLVAFRNNLLYICKRCDFNLIPLLGTAYGFLKNPQCDKYWWNSESQFESICYHANVTTFNYNTEYEGSSLYQFDRTIYFDEHNQVRNPSQLFCMVRS